MEPIQLAKELRQAYEVARRNEATCQVLLFGIRYAEDLENCGAPLKKIVELSGIGKGYVSEVSKGVKLARYVEIKEGEWHNGRS